jgi:hypothetical protein
MRTSPSRQRRSFSKDDVLEQVRALLDRPDDDIQAALLKELLTGVLRLQESQLEPLDLKILNRALKELRYAFGVFQKYRGRPKVSIFGSARTALDDPCYQMAYEFCRRMVEEGFMVITGGADGIMRAGQEGAGREHSFGVNILLPFEQGANAVIAEDPKLITFKYFFTRKLTFQKESNAIALFPGGFGTHDEGFEILTLAQTGKSDPKPIVCLHPPGSQYWHQWNAFLTDQLLKKRLINEEDLSLFRIVDSVEDGVAEVLQFYRRYHSLRFVGRQLAIRLKCPLTRPQTEELSPLFHDLLAEGTFEQRDALPEELDEPAVKDLPRLVFVSNRRSAGRLRQLIDYLNRLPRAPLT